MQTEASLERDSDVIQDYIDVLNRKASRPTPFGKLAALTKLGALGRRLATAIARHPDPDLERAEAAVAAGMSRSWMRRVATSYWGSRALLVLALVAGQQLVLFALMIVSALYTNMAARPVSPETGYLPAVTRFGVIFLVVFVFAFFFVTPLFSVLLIWGGRFLRSWRMTIPVTVLLMVTSAAFTYLCFRDVQNPAFTPDSLHQFVEIRKSSSFDAYTKWLEMKADPTRPNLNWLLKDAKFRVDYEDYLRKGPGRWFLNRFDTVSSTEWADPQRLADLGVFVDSQHDPAKFEEWLKDYIDRNKINTPEVDRAIENLTSPSNARFLSIWQATPFLEERDVHVRRNYFNLVYSRIQYWGLWYFGGLAFLYLVCFLVGPTLIGVAWIGRSLKLGAIAKGLERLRDAYYDFPEHRDLLAEPFYDSSRQMLARVHRSYVRAATGITLIVFVIWAVWLTSWAAEPHPAATQNALMTRFVLFPSSGAAIQTGASGLQASQLPTQSLVQPADARTAAFPGGVGDPTFGSDEDGDGFPDEAPLSPVEARLLALQKQFDDADYDTRKRFKATEALLVAYKKEIDTLKTQNTELQQRANDLTNLTNTLSSQIAATDAAARSASGRAESALTENRALSSRVDLLGQTFDETAREFGRRSDALEKRDEQMQTTIDLISADLDERTTDLKARTERLGERAADLAERTEQIGDMERTAVSALVDQFRHEVNKLQRRSQSRLYRWFNKKEARAEILDLRQRIQAVRAMLQGTPAPEAERFWKELTELQQSIDPIEQKFR